MCANGFDASTMAGGLRWQDAAVTGGAGLAVLDAVQDADLFTGADEGGLCAGFVLGLLAHDCAPYGLAGVVR